MVRLPPLSGAASEEPEKEDAAAQRAEDTGQNHCDGDGAESVFADVLRVGRHDELCGPW